MLVPFPMLAGACGAAALATVLLEIPSMRLLSPLPMVLPLVLVLACTSGNDDTGSATTDTANGDSGDTDTDSGDTDTDGTDTADQESVSPEPGADGALSLDGITDTQATLSWTAATDNVSSAADLRYQVYRSSEDNLATVAYILANGTEVGSSSLDLTSVVVDGLASGVEVYLNVLVTDQNGNQAAYGATSVVGRHKHNELVGMYWYDGGEIEEYRTLHYNADGLIAGSAVFSQPGPDATWETADDGQDEAVTYTYDGLVSSRIDYYDGAGADGLWGTSDDVVDKFDVYEFDANGHPSAQVRYDASGEVSRYQHIVSDADGNPLVSYTFTSLGADGVFGTADDVCSSGVFNTFNASGQRVSSYAVNSRGPDDLCNTSDDVRYAHFSYEYDSAGNRSRSFSYDRYGTELSNITTVNDYTTHSSGVEESFKRYTSAGEDGTWLTSDDVLALYTNSEFNSAGQRTGRFNYEYENPTVLSKYSHYTYTSDGLLEAQRDYTDPGVDGTWQTPDDTGPTYTLYTYDADGELAEQRHHQTGPDELFDTSDDVVERVERYQTVYSVLP